MGHHPGPPAQQHRQSGPQRDVIVQHDLRPADEAQNLEKAWLAVNAIREVVCIRIGRARDQPHFVAETGETARQRIGRCLDTAEVGQEGVSIDQDAHGNPMPARACLTPAMSSRNPHPSMISRLRRPSAAVWAGEASASARAAASRSTLLTGKIEPFSPGRTKSGPDPTWSLTTMARPAFIASFTTRPHGSRRDGNTKTSARS